MSDFFDSLIIVFGAYLLSVFARDLFRRRRAALCRFEEERKEIVFFRALWGLMQGGLSIPSAKAVLGKPKAARGSPLLWETLDYVYQRGLNGTEILARLLPILDERLRMNRRIFALRERALVQFAFAALVPWVIAGAFRLLSADAPVEPPTFGLNLFAMAYQGLGGWLAWRLASFY